MGSKIPLQSLICETPEERSHYCFEDRGYELQQVLDARHHDKCAIVHGGTYGGKNLAM